jgi:hypothetical protein
LVDERHLPREGLDSSDGRAEQARSPRPRCRSRGWGRIRHRGRVGRLSSAVVRLTVRACRPGGAWGEQAPGPQPGRSLGSDPSARDRGGHQYRQIDIHLPLQRPVGPGQASSDRPITIIWSPGFLSPPRMTAV